jgi:hypothetical protein
MGPGTVAAGAVGEMARVADRAAMAGLVARETQEAGTLARVAIAAAQPGGVPLLEMAMAGAMGTLMRAALAAAEAVELAAATAQAVLSEAAQVGHLEAPKERQAAGPTVATM